MVTSLLSTHRQLRYPILFVLMLIPRLAEAQTGLPDFGAAGLPSVLPLPLWISPSHGPFFEHPISVLAISKPYVTTAWVVDRTLNDRSPSVVDRFRIHGTRRTLEFASPLIAGSDSVYVGHIAMRYDGKNHDMTFPLSSDGQLMRHTLDYQYGQVTYGRTAGAHWQFGGSVGIAAKPGDRQVNYNIQSVYDHAGLLRASLMVSRRTARHFLDLDLENRQHQAYYHIDLPPSEHRVNAAVTSYWTPFMSWAVEGQWQTTRSATRVTSSEGAFRFPMVLDQWTVKTGPTFQFLSGGIRLWSRLQGTRYGTDMTLFHEEGNDRAGQLRGTGSNRGWEVGLFSGVSRSAAIVIHFTDHRMRWDASGHLSPQHIIDLPYFFDLLIGNALNRQFYQTNVGLNVRGFGMMYLRRLRRNGLLSIGLHRAIFRVDGHLSEWFYPDTGSAQLNDQEIVMRPKILNTLFIDARYPIRNITLQYQFSRIIPYQGAAPVSTGQNPIDIQPFKDRRLTTGGSHVVSLRYDFGR